MSCITELLKLKGNKEVLILLDEYGKPWVAAEGGGTYKDYEFLIILNIHGHRCGYVALPPGHPANNVEERHKRRSEEYIELDYDKLDISCHGGLTFGGNHHGLKTLLKNECKDNWIGFDCGHYGDSPDTGAFKKYFGEEEFNQKKSFFDVMSHHGSIVCEYDYAKKECESIIDQLIIQEQNINETKSP